MGIIRSLDQMKSLANNSGNSGNKQYFDWKSNSLKLAAGAVAKIRFAQELDVSSPAYVEKNGQGVVVVEHRPQHLFPKRVVCTMGDEGECWACEQRQLTGDKEWRQRTNLYVNVLVDDGKGNWTPKLLSQGYGPKSVTPWLIDYAGEVGSISGQVFRISRQGSGQTDTQYTVFPVGAPDASPFDYTQYELFNIEDDILNKVASDEMEAYFYAGKKDAETEADTSTSPDEAWV